MATYENMAELIRLGAYRRGSDGAVDESITFYPGIEKFLAQDIEEKAPLASCYEQLRTILSMPVEVANPPGSSIPPQSVPVEEPLQNKSAIMKDSEVVDETDQVVGEQTLSLDTLSGLNSIGEN